MYSADAVRRADPSAAAETKESFHLFVPTALPQFPVSAGGVGYSC